MAPIQLIIFTDMDGSLLDHETYSHEPADEVLAWLRSNQIPVVPCTSKTRAEMLVLSEELALVHPFVVENGAAIYMPPAYFPNLLSLPNDVTGLQVKKFTHSRAHWQAILANVPVHLNDAFVTFEALGVEGIMQLTGLGVDEARRASQREFGEPLKWLGNEEQLQQFKRYIDSQQGKLLEGGRFIHLSGDCDKGQALLWLVEQFHQHANNKNIVSVALGDSQNDVAMLSAADYAVVIKSQTHEFPKLEDKNQQHVYYTSHHGPVGWKEGIMHVLNELGINQ